MTHTDRPHLSSAVAWSLMIFLSLIWGSSFILIKTSLTLFDPVEVGALRVLISALCFMPILVVRRRHMKWRSWPYLVIVALTGSGVPAFLYPLAQTEIQSAVAGIINALTPLFTLMLGVIVFHQTFHRSYLIGILLGLLGVIILFIHDIDLSDTGQSIAYVLAILATLCYGTSVNTVERFLKRMDPIALSASSFVLLGPISLMILIGQGTFTTIAQAPNLNPLMAVSALAILGTFLSTMIFFYMVQRTSALFSALVAYLIPIVAVSWGILYGESITIYDIGGLVIILLGVYLSKVR